MGLELIFNNRSLKELKPKLKEYFPTPKLKLNDEIRSPARTTNYSTVGQAFDYLIRFYLEIKYPEKVFKRELVAEKAFGIILHRLAYSDADIIGAGRKFETRYNRKELLGHVLQEHLRVDRNFQVAKEKNRITDDLIKSCLFLARMDVTVRAGIIDPNFLLKSDEDLFDLKALYKNLNWRSFRVKDHCILNPTFGKGSNFILGADGDLIIDDTLIDIKVTKELKVRRAHLNQLFVYHTLYLMGGVDSIPHKIKINNIGIYYARHSKLLKFPLSEFGTQKNFKEFRKWFEEYVNKNLFGINK